MFKSRDPKHSDSEFDCDCPYCLYELEIEDEEEQEWREMFGFFGVQIDRQSPEIERILDEWFD